MEAREKLKIVALSNHKDGSVAHWFDPYKELLTWGGAGGGKRKQCVARGRGEGFSLQSGTG